MVSESNLLRIALAFIVLIYASVLDWKYREIDDKSWLSLVALGIAFAGYDYFSLRDADVLKLFGLSLALSFIIAFSLSWLGLMATGDAFVLFGVGALFPYHIFETSSLFPLFVLSVFSNAVVLSAFLPLVFFLKNLGELREVRELKGFFALFIGYRRRASEVRRFESIFGAGGEFRFFQNANSMPLGKNESLSGDAMVWVTPALPFVIPITMGLALSLIWGDIISFAVMKMTLEVVL